MGVLPEFPAFLYNPWFQLIIATPVQFIAGASFYEGKTAMFVSIEGEFTGIIAVADTVKEHSKKAIQQLKELGLEVIMLTGDNKRTAEAIGNEVGVSRIIAKVLPEWKAQEIKKLQKVGFVVAMVGEGINDAPALATADIGMAMGTGAPILRLKQAISRGYGI